MQITRGGGKELGEKGKNKGRRERTRGEGKEQGEEGKN
jgi:hypothetical protein